MKFLCSFSQFGSITCLLVVCNLSACSSAQSHKKDLEAQLVGPWTTLATQLTLNTENGSPETRAFNVSEGEWEVNMHRLPPQSTYFADHRYASRLVLLSENEQVEPADTVKQDGTWALQADSLFIYAADQKDPIAYYQIKIQNDRLELNSTMDIDNDGIKDDQYWMLLRRGK